MNRPALLECEMRMALPATLQAVEEFLRNSARQRQAMLDRVDCFAAELLVREALTNAVVHGCHADPANRSAVPCGSRAGACSSWSKTMAMVSTGARPGVVPGAFPDCSGRGIEILSKYANRVRYNDRGNVVTIIKRF